MLQTDLDGRIPLHLAATAGRHDCLRILTLIMYARDIDTIDLKDGRTALHKAVRQAGGTAGEHRTALDNENLRLRLECVKLLLEAGAEPTRRDFERQSVFDLADAASNSEVRLELQRLLKPTRGIVPRLRRAFARRQ